MNIATPAPRVCVCALCAPTVPCMVCRAHHSVNDIEEHYKNEHSNIGAKVFPAGFFSPGAPEWSYSQPSLVQTLQFVHSSESKLVVGAEGAIPAPSVLHEKPNV